MNRFIKTSLHAAIGLCLVGAAALAQAETVHLGATLSAKAEVPPNDSAATGTFDATFDTATNVLQYKMTYSGMSGPVTAAHLHGPAAPGANAGVAVPFAPPLASPIEGKATLSADQAKDLLAGQYYVNVHTAKNPGGEIRGQVMKK